MFKRVFKQHILSFVYSTTLVGTTVLSYLGYRTYHNRKQFQEEQENDQFYKDMTRQDNSYYGINWGFRADQLISDKIDAGDIFLIKYECDECLQLGDMLKCKTLQIFYNNEQDYDSIGFAFRNSQGLFIIANQFGKTQVMEYNEFLAQPFLKEMSLRKLIFKNNNEDIQRNFYKRLNKHFKYLYEKVVHQSAEQMAYEYMVALNFIQPQIIQESQEQNNMFRPPLNSYDDSHPFYLIRNIDFDNKIIIRTKSNKELRREN